MDEVRLHPACVPVADIVLSCRSQDLYDQILNEEGIGEDVPAPPYGLGFGLGSPDGYDDYFDDAFAGTRPFREPPSVPEPPSTLLPAPPPATARPPRYNPPQRNTPSGPSAYSQPQQLSWPRHRAPSQPHAATQAMQQQMALFDHGASEPVDMQG
jgi:hypothetical protein